MPKLVVTNRAGEATVVNATAGPSVMENIRDNGFDELLALCGGCATDLQCWSIAREVWDALGPLRRV